MKKIPTIWSHLPEKKLTHPYIILSAAIATLILLSASVGISTPSVYETEAFEWQVQAVWQDYVNVFLVIPVMLISANYAYYNRTRAKYIWAGSLVYLIYTYVIYSFDIHFNGLFIFYCLILGCSFYSLAWFAYLKTIGKTSDHVIRNNVHLLTATYFIILGSAFYLLWLYNIVPPMLKQNVPPGLEEYDLPTNPVHVLDLAIILPAFIITGIMTFSNKGPWQMLTAVLLVFSTLMSITICGLQIAMFIADLTWDPVIAFIMLLLAGIDIILFQKTTAGGHKGNTKVQTKGQVVLH